MAILGAFRDGWTALVTDPSLVIAGLVVAAATAVSTVGTVAHGSAVSSLTPIVWALAFPFALGGFLGMALPALRGEGTSLADFLRAGRTHYLRLFAATMLFLAVVIAVVSVPMTIGFVTVVAVMVLASASGSVGAGVGMAAFVAIVLAMVVGLAVAVLFLQFYGTAIVVEDSGVTEAFARSARLVRTNLPGVVGFTAVWLVLTNTVLAPEYLVRAVLADPPPPTVFGVTVAVPLAVLVPAGVALTAVGVAYLYAVQTAYFLRLAAATPAADGGDAAA